jgi:hypothetical protein
MGTAAFVERYMPASANGTSRDLPGDTATTSCRVICTASAMLAADMAMRLRETLEAPSSFASGIR